MMNSVDRDSSCQVLIVEDEPLIALDLKTRVEDFGLTVCGIADSGAKAIALAEDMTPDLILMDLCLKDDIDGVDAACRILDRAAVPIIFVTANSEPQSIARMKAVGATDLLFKPIHAGRLRSAIDHALAG